MRWLLTKLVVGVFSCALFAPLQASQTGAPPASPPVALLNNATIASVQRIAMETPYGSLPRGLGDSSGASTRLFVVSSRNMIASRTAEVAGTRGRFTPTGEMRRDIVYISCGDHDLGEIFACSRVQARSLSGRIITPITYQARANAYRNALGATWTVREVDATYEARQLAQGFVVDYASPDGGVWTFTVSAEQAAIDLLLDISVATAAAAAGSGPAPSRLSVSIAREGEAWTIMNGDAYRWQRCVASIRASEAPMGALEPNGTITVTRSQFQPAIPNDALSTPLSVTCYVGRDQMFITTEQP